MQFFCFLPEDSTWLFGIRHGTGDHPEPIHCFFCFLLTDAYTMKEFLF